MPNYEPFNKSKALVVGLGYAQSIDDFKVLGVSNFYIDRAFKIGLHVFSLRNNTWKIFETNFGYFIETYWAI